MWTAERKLEAALPAPFGRTGRTSVRDDTRIITRPRASPGCVGFEALFEATSWSLEP